MARHVADRRGLSGPGSAWLGSLGNACWCKLRTGKLGSVQAVPASFVKLRRGESVRGLLGQLWRSMLWRGLAGRGRRGRLGMAVESGPVKLMQGRVGQAH